MTTREWREQLEHRAEEVEPTPFERAVMGTPATAPDPVMGTVGPPDPDLEPQHVRECRETDDLADMIDETLGEAVRQQYLNKLTGAQIERDQALQALRSATGRTAYWIRECREQDERADTAERHRDRLMTWLGVFSWLSLGLAAVLAADLIWR